MFKKAERVQTKLKIAVTGPSGSGKTYSALLLAKGLGDKIALVDTENGSASLYSHVVDFDKIDLSPPFTVEKYLEAVKAAVAGGYEVLVIDSITPEWSGDGGLLAQKEQLDSRGGNQYANWAPITKKHNQFVSSLVHAEIHLVATMRSKQGHEIVEENGKKKVQKMGLAAQQRDGIEYEFTTVFDIAMNHEAEASKDRTGLFPTQTYFKINEQTGKKYLEWMKGASDVHIPPTKEQVAKIFATAKEYNVSNSEVQAIMRTRYQKASTSELTYPEVCDLLKAIPELAMQSKAADDDEKFPFEK